MVLNPEKSLFFCVTKESIELGNKTLHAEAEQTIIGIIIGKDINFQSHANSILKAANQMLSALTESHYLWLISIKPIKRLYFNSFIKSRFNYCPLLWIFRTRVANHKIIRLHEREFKALLNDEISIFKDMLSKCDDTAVYVKIIQKLMIEFYKYL